MKKVLAMAACAAAWAAEPADRPEASYAVMRKATSGGVYIFHKHNTDNIRQARADDPPYKGGYWTRVDSSRPFAFQYRDDHGRSWSAKRYPIPRRLFEIDRKNPYQGKRLCFRNAGKAFAGRGAGYAPVHEIGRFGDGGFAVSEGAVLRSENILTERDPGKIRWETLPEGETGIQTPAGGGPVAEEHSFSILSDGSLFTVFRTIGGHSAFSYSRNGGRTWEPSQYAEPRLALAGGRRSSAYRRRPEGGTAPAADLWPLSADVGSGGELSGWGVKTAVPVFMWRPARAEVGMNGTCPCALAHWREARVG